MRKMEAALKAAERQSAVPGHGIAVSALRRWVDLRKCVPDAERFNLTKLDITPRRISLVAELADGKVAAEFRDRVAASEMFAPEPYTLDPGPNGKGYVLKMDVGYTR